MFKKLLWLLVFIGCFKKVDQKEMSKDEWWKVISLRCKGKRIEVMLARIMCPPEDDQILVCDLSELGRYDLYILKPLREGREVHISFGSRLRESGEKVYTLNHYAPVRRGEMVRSVNVPHLLAELSHEQGHNIGPASKV